MKSLALILMICSFVSSAQDRPLATVNDRPITEAQVNVRLKPVFKQFKLKPGSREYDRVVPLLRKKVLDTLIDRAVALTSDKAKAATVSDTDLDKRVKKIAAAEHGGDLSALKQSLPLDGQTFSDWRRDIRESMVIARVRDGLAKACRQCTEEEARALYQKEKTLFKSGGRVKVSLIRLDPGTIETQNLRMFATAVRDRVMGADEEEWDTVAKEYSSGPKAGSGGHWDWTKLSELPDGLARTVDGMEVGSIVRVTRRKRYYVVRLDAVEKLKQIPFAAARLKVEAEVMRRKAGRAWQSWLSAEKRKAKITIGASLAE